MDVDRYLHAARETERFARLRVYEATEREALAQARGLLRLAIGLRRKLEKWAAPAPPDHQPPHARRRVSPRPSDRASDHARPRAEQWRNMAVTP